MYELPNEQNVTKVVIDEKHHYQRRQALADLSGTGQSLW